MFNIADKVAELSRNGMLRSAHYSVEVTVPQRVQQLLTQSGVSTTGLMQGLAFRVDSAGIPAQALKTSNVNRYGVGVSEKMPNNIQFQDTSFTTILDKRGDIYRVFDNWIAYIFSGNRNKNPQRPLYTGAYKKEYTAIIKIHVYAPDGSRQMTVVLDEAFPVSMAEIPLAWEGSNQLIKGTIGIAFTSWYLERNNQQTDNSFF